LPEKLPSIRLTRVSQTKLFPQKSKAISKSVYKKLPIQNATICTFHLTFFNGFLCSFVFLLNLCTVHCFLAQKPAQWRGWQPREGSKCCWIQCTASGNTRAWIIFRDLAHLSGNNYNYNCFERHLHFTFHCFSEISLS
jgi:hypothetical protein